MRDGQTVHHPLCDCAFCKAGFSAERTIRLKEQLIREILYGPREEKEDT